MRGKGIGNYHYANDYKGKGRESHIEFSKYVNVPKRKKLRKREREGSGREAGKNVVLTCANRGQKEAHPKA